MLKTQVFQIRRLICGLLVIVEIILGLFFTQFVEAANITTRLVVNYGSYQMSGLHTLQEGIINNYRMNGIDLQSFGSFPPYLNFQLQILEEPHGGIGFFYDFASTGSRVHYSDYSGEINFDMTVFRAACGPMVEIPIMKNNPLSLLAFWQVALHITVVQVKESCVFHVNSAYDFHDSETTRVPGIFFRIGAALPVHVVSRSILLIAAYEYDLSIRTLSYYYIDERGLKCNWTGWRLGMAVSITEG